GAVAEARTVTAVAVPLRKAAAGSRPQHPDFHNASRLAGRSGPRPRCLRHPAQRLAIYSVISMPNRKSVACGISQRICILLCGMSLISYRIAVVAQGPDPAMSFQAPRGTPPRL